MNNTINFNKLAHLLCHLLGIHKWDKNIDIHQGEKRMVQYGRKYHIKTGMQTCTRCLHKKQVTSIRCSGQHLWTEWK